MPENNVSLNDLRTRASEPSVVEFASSLGDRSTQAEGMSSVSDSGALAANLDEQLELADLSARYEFGEVLGRGGMGEVLKAHDKRLERPVAIKRILGEGARSPMALRRFLTEARSLAQLNHFNVVQVYDYGRDARGPFLILEYVAGKGLQERLKDGPLSVEQAVDLACQLCDGLSAAHQRGIIHRDVKPANVLLTERGEPKLTDFGLAHRETNDDGRTQAGAVLGTIDFMPPEQRRDATQADARSDLWSLAATLYQMLTGKTPKVIRLDLVPDALRSALGKALEEEPAQRYETAAVFKEALRNAAASLHKAASFPKLELVEDVCPQCGTKNDPIRKFCKSCRGALTIECLNCKTKIKVWEDVCGECGASQKEETAKVRAFLERQLETADSLGREYRYEEALQFCETVQNENLTFLADLHESARRLVRQLTEERDKQLRAREVILRNSQNHFAAGNFGAALKAVGEIPTYLRNEECVALQNLATERLNESGLLLTEIRRRVASKELNGLEQLTLRMLELQPSHAQVGKLHQDLLQRLRRNQRKSQAAKTSESQLETTAIPSEALDSVDIGATPFRQGVPDSPSLRLPKVSNDLRILPRKAHEEQTLTVRAKRAKELLHRPAAYLLITTALDTFLSGAVLLLALLHEDVWDTSALFGFLIVVVWFAIDLFVVVSGISLVRLKNFPLVVAGIAIALLPVRPCWLFSLPFAIWALVRLRQREIRNCFR